MDEGIPTSPETPGDAVPATGERAKEVPPVAPSEAAVDTDRDFELARPGATPGARSVREVPEGFAGSDGGERGGSGGDGESARAAVASAGAVQQVSGDGDGQGEVGSGSVGEGAFELTPPVRDADRPQEPRHAPDPYGTPPYGRPGPWAPSPPVQHPAAPAPAPAAAQQPPPLLLPLDAPRDARAPLQQTDAVAPWERRRTRSRRTFVAGALLLAVVSGAVGGLIGAYLERTGGLESVQLPQPGPPPPGRPPGSVAAIAARALPSVVTLQVTGAGEQATGTGFVLDTRGHILTNNHVVAPAVSAGGRITVTFSGGTAARATVVGRDTGYDLAVVQVHGVRGLTPLPLGDSDAVRVGDPVVAIGAPFDLPGTVTAGIISAKERPITSGGGSGDGSDVSYVDALQTDAPINPGNSGGPLLDFHARAVGVNSAIRSADGQDGSGDGQAGSIGLGFAIPINQAKRVAEELIATGKATHPVIGITLDMDYTGDGARIEAKAADGGPAVTANGPGARAGLEAGDVITALDGQPVHSGEELIVRTRSYRPGDRLSLTVERAGAEKRLTLVLGSSDRN
ncbi:S1C family serine protease [Streptomyces sp. NPDC007901]|uniref:S1C family serine protease n=1 Tax=Streptomyces sp. NPDC007901 TaxID=3364785 RepID=UPI0036F06BB2